MLARHAIEDRAQGVVALTAAYFVCLMSGFNTR
jgi:hypothetical protein